MWLYVGVYARMGTSKDQVVTPKGPWRTPLGCTRHLRKLSRDPMRALNDTLKPTKAVHGAILGPEKCDFPAMRATFNFCEDFDLFLERGMSKDHPATPQGLPRTRRGCTKDLPGPSGNSQRPQREHPRTTLWPNKDPPGLPWDAPETSETLLRCTKDLQRPPRDHIRTLKCRTGLTRDVHGAILRPEKHGFPTGRATLGVFKASTCFLDNSFSTIEDEKPLLQFHLLNARQNQNCHKSDDHNNRILQYMERPYTDFWHVKYGFLAGRATFRFWGFEEPHLFLRKSALCYSTQLSNPTAARARKSNNSIPPIYQKRRISENQLFIFIY